MGFEITAHTADCPVAAAENAAEKLYAIQFHPEVLHTPEGTKMINNFVKNVCGCVGEWKMDAFVEKYHPEKSVKKLGTEGSTSCAFQVELIPLWQQDCFPEQSANSLPAYYL